MAPDPKDPNIIYLSGTYGSVDRFDRRIGLSQNITPWPALTFGSEIDQRKYRDPWTPVLLFSPADTDNSLFRNAICDEDRRWRSALADHQP